MSRTAACTECTHPGGIRVTKQGRLYSHDRTEPCPGSRQRPTETGACGECTHPSTPVTRQGVLQDHDRGVRCPGSGRAAGGGVREELIEIVTRDPESSGSDETWATDLVDHHAAEVRREDAATVRATKLHGPLNYDDGRVNRALERAAKKIEEGANA